MNRSVSVGLLALAILVVIVGATGSAAAMGVGTGDSLSVSSVQGQPTEDTHSLQSDTVRPGQPNVDSRDFDTTTFDITVHENGSATWTFRYEQRFDGDDETEQRENFEAFAEQFESESDDTGLYDRFQSQAQSMTNTGIDETDREMDATNFNRSARIEGQLNPVGVVEMSFTWHGFAAVDDQQNQLAVGDVFQGIYLTEDQTIIVRPDDGLEFQTANPDPQYVGTSLEGASSIRWSGQREFIDGHPRIILEPEGGDGGGIVGSSGSVWPETDGDGTPWIAAIGVGILVLALATLAVWYRRQGTRDGDTARPVPTPPTADESPTGPQTESSPDTTAGEQSTTPLEDDELLTDEDRVVKLIRENGGRMKQVNIVEETGWSKSKVSMLLSDMEDDGTISKLRVGRENIISLEGFEPEATKSPFDE
ncbi:helix-turn-helix transcriptional regulator [Natronobacterium texcoconense]|uniref:IclR helix-turn-helix domain-containing protein n=1 Tax=Natronobacterium texcoconense TaxID=1095778 RepID=A0A1H1G240_NATTX|nr:hypothetical protein [Natronobacterium texcoconense]SDR06948.1 hypothetical protein SAMN04489842_2211 [Natronobacterium texcoconense]